MKNTAFVIWIILFPLSIDISHYLSFLEGKKYLDNSKSFAVLVLVIWAGIASLLYEKHKTKKEDGK